MNKDLIHSRFAKTLSSYEENAKIQKIMAEKLIGFAKKKKYKEILEIGCGTGFLTKFALSNLEFEHYTAIDIVEECRKYVLPLNKKIEFVSMDIEKYLQENQNKYDLIISNASLQWVDNFESAIKKLKTSLNKDGELIFSTFGKENFREIYYLLGTTLQYFSSKELEEMFGEFEIKTEEEIRIMAFKTPKDVLKHLQLTGVNAIENKSWTKKDLKEFENGYLNICSSRPTLTYHPIYVCIS